MLAKVFEYAFGAGDTKTFPGGRFFRLLSAPTAVDVEFFDESGQSMGICEGVTTGFAMSFYPADLGKSAPLISFGKVQITSAGAQTVQAVIARQPVSFDALSGTVDANLVKAATLTDTADVALVDAAAAAQLLAANTARRTAIITAKSANTGPVRIGTAPNDTRGYELAPGTSVFLDVTAAIKGFAPTGGGNQTVTLLEIAD